MFAGPLKTIRNTVKSHSNNYITNIFQCFIEIDIWDEIGGKPLKKLFRLTGAPNRALLRGPTKFPNSVNLHCLPKKRRKKKERRTKIATTSNFETFPRKLRDCSTLAPGRVSGCLSKEILINSPRKFANLQDPGVMRISCFFVFCVYSDA